MKHIAKYKLDTYGYGGYARSIAWTCNCGKSGEVDDGVRRGPTMTRARASFKRHVARELATAAAK